MKIVRNPRRTPHCTAACLHIPICSRGAAALLLLVALIGLTYVAVADDMKLEVVIWLSTVVAVDTITCVFPEEIIVLSDTEESGLKDIVTGCLAILLVVPVSVAIMVISSSWISERGVEGSAFALGTDILCIEGGTRVVGSDTITTSAPFLVSVLPTKPGKNGRSATGMVVASEITISFCGWTGDANVVVSGIMTTGLPLIDEVTPTKSGKKGMSAIGIILDAGVTMTGEFDTTGDAGRPPMIELIICPTDAKTGKGPGGSLEAGSGDGPATAGLKVEEGALFEVGNGVGLNIDGNGCGELFDFSVFTAGDTGSGVGFGSPVVGMSLSSSSPEECTTTYTSDISD